MKSMHKASWEAVFSRGQDRNGGAADGRIRTPYNIPAEVGDNRPMRSNIDAPPKISFDLDGVVTLNKSFAPGGTIFSQGDVAKTLMYIQAGSVKLSVASEAGEVAIVAILGSGDFLGEACLGSQNIRIRTATAIAPTALQVIERNEMIRALRADRALSYAFLSYLISRNIRIEEDFVESVAFVKYHRGLDANGGIHINTCGLAKTFFN